MKMTERKKDFYWVLEGRGDREVYRRLEKLVEERWPGFARHLRGLVKDRSMYVNQLYSDHEERKIVEKALEELR